MIWMARAHVVKVVDGDTFHARLDIGWGITLAPRGGKEPGQGTVRLLVRGGGRYDAPEKGTAAGRRALGSMMILLPLASVVEIHSHDWDSFGRTLASVDLPDGRDLASVMIEMGYTK